MQIDRTLVKGIAQNFIVLVLMIIGAAAILAVFKEIGFVGAIPMLIVVAPLIVGSRYIWKAHGGREATCLLGLLFVGLLVIGFSSI